MSQKKLSSVGAPPLDSLTSMNGTKSNDWSEDTVIRCGIIDDIFGTRRERTKLTRGRSILLRYSMVMNRRRVGFNDHHSEEVILRG